MAELPVKALLVDRILEGDLFQLIDQGRANKESWESIARRIWVATTYSVQVTGVTVKAWHDAMTASEPLDAA